MAQRPPQPVDGAETWRAEPAAGGPAAVPRPSPATAAVPREPVPSGELACTLLTEDQVLIEQLASIALSAAVRINHCSSVHQLDEQAWGSPVLWGADLLGQLDPGTHRCDVLVGSASHNEALWLMASARPQARVALLPHAAGWLGEYLGQWALRSGHGHVLCLSGLAGGIGTSALACLLAHAGTLSGMTCLVLDLDPFSGSLWPMLNWQETTQIGWEHLRSSGGTLAAHQFRDALPTVQDTAVLTWRHEPASFAIDQSLAVRVLAAARQAFDLVVIDAGRHPHPHAEALAQFTDAQVITCQPEQAHRAAQLGRPFIACAGAHRLQLPAATHPQLLGLFPPSPRIARSIERAELLEALHSGQLRQQLANYDLLPHREASQP